MSIVYSLLIGKTHTLYIERLPPSYGALKLIVFIIPLYNLLIILFTSPTHHEAFFKRRCHNSFCIFTFPLHSYKSP